MSAFCVILWRTGFSLAQLNAELERRNPTFQSNQQNEDKIRDDDCEHVIVPGDNFCLLYCFVMALIGHLNMPMACALKHFALNIISQSKELITLLRHELRADIKGDAKIAAFDKLTDDEIVALGRQPYSWPGQVVADVLAKYFKIKVMVYAAKTPVQAPFVGIRFGNEKLPDDRMMHIAFNAQGNHYNYVMERGFVAFAHRHGGEVRGATWQWRYLLCELADLDLELTSV